MTGRFVNARSTKLVSWVVINIRLHSNRERGSEKEAMEACFLIRRGADDNFNKVIYLKAEWYKVGACFVES